MSVEQRVIDIVCDHFASTRSRSRAPPRSSRTSAPTRSTSSNSSWNSKKSSRSRFPTTRPRRSRPSARPSTTSRRRSRTSAAVTPPMQRRRSSSPGWGRSTRSACPCRTTGEACSPGRAASRPSLTSTPPHSRSSSAARSRTSTPSRFSTPRTARKLDRFSQFALVAAAEAVKDSGLDFAKEDPFRCGCIVGSGIGGLSEFEDGTKTLIERGPGRLSPFVIPKMIANAGTGNISIQFGLRGPNTAVATACSSAAHAIGDSLAAIRVRLRRRHGHRRHRGRHHAAGPGRLHRLPRALRTQRRPGTRQPAVRQGPRRLRPQRRGRHPRPRRIRTRQGARREHLRRGARLRQHGRRLPHHRPARRRHRRRRGDARPPFATPAGTPTTCSTSTPTAPAPAWATRPRRRPSKKVFGDHAKQADDLQHQEHDRPPARRQRRRRGDRLCADASSTASSTRRSTCSTRTPNPAATSITSRTTPAKSASRSSSPTASASAGTTARWRSGRCEPFQLLTPPAVAISSGVSIAGSFNPFIRRVEEQSQDDRPEQGRAHRVLEDRVVVQLVADLVDHPQLPADQVGDERPDAEDQHVEQPLGARPHVLREELVHEDVHGGEEERVADAVQRRSRSRPPTARGRTRTPRTAPRGRARRRSSSSASRASSARSRESASSRSRRSARSSSPAGPSSRGCRHPSCRNDAVQ